VPCKPEDLGFRKRAAAGIAAPGLQELCLFYKTTAGFTREIRRHLASSSVTKKPVSSGYSNSFIEKNHIEFSMFVYFYPQLFNKFSVLLTGNGTGYGGCCYNP